MWIHVTVRGHALQPDELPLVFFGLLSLLATSALGVLLGCLAEQLLDHAVD